MSDKQNTMIRPNGLVIVQGGDGRTFEADTRMCCHCGKHWLVQPGSGNVRGFCGKCNAMICGPGCLECVPLEKQLEILEGTRNPSAVSVGGGYAVG